MLIWFAPLLVVFNGLPPLEAMKLSFAACLKNMLPFLVYGVGDSGAVVHRLDPAPARPAGIAAGAVLLGLRELQGHLRGGGQPGRPHQRQPVPALARMFHGQMGWRDF